jgi:hypothetical protein
MEMKMSTENKLMKVLGKSLSLDSLDDLVRVRSNENSVLLIDVSGSMGAFMRNGKTRINGLREVVAGIQSKRTTQMIAFGLNPGASLDPTGLEPRSAQGEVDFVNEVPDAQNTTPLAEGIDFARVNGFGRAVVISDGAPNDRNKALDAARNFGGRVDVIFVGDPGEPGSLFLEQLASATGGQRFEGDLSDVKEITGAVIGLLNGEVLEEDDDDEDDGDDDGDDEDEDEEDED